MRTALVCAWGICRDPGSPWSGSHRIAPHPRCFACDGLIGRQRNCHLRRPQKPAYVAKKSRFGTQCVGRSWCYVCALDGHIGGVCRRGGRPGVGGNALDELHSSAVRCNCADSGNGTTLLRLCALPDLLAHSLIDHSVRCEEPRRPHTGAYSTTRPQATSDAPPAFPSQCPSGMVFSRMTKTVSPTIQYRFITPPKNSSAIKNQQHPRQ